MRIKKLVVTPKRKEVIFLRKRMKYILFLVFKFVIRDCTVRQINTLILRLKHPTYI
jgi:hypothetical protein